MRDFGAGAAILAACIVALFGVTALGFVGCGEIKDFNRSQKLKTTRNNVKVTEINVAKARQRARITNAEIEITKAEAKKRYEESVGIKRAQDEISATLTPLYVQHEAIKAMERGAADKVYIPVGNGGVPLVNNVGSEPATTVTVKR